MIVEKMRISMMKTRLVRVFLQFSDCSLRENAV